MYVILVCLGCIVKIRVYAIVFRLFQNDAQHATKIDAPQLWKSDTVMRYNEGLSRDVIEHGVDSSGHVL